MARSPNYPAISLPEAIASAKRVYESHQRKTITDDELAKAMGYKGLSGPSRSKISALKKYGLVDRSANGWRLADRAMQIILKPKESDDYQRAISAAILDVELFAQLMESHTDASPGALMAYLEADLGFTRDGAEAAAKSFLETMGLAQGTISATMPRADGDDSSTISTPPNGKSESMVTLNPQHQPSNGVLPLPVLMDDGSIQLVVIPRMTEAAFEFFKRQLDTYKPAIVMPEKPAGGQ